MSAKDLREDGKTEYANKVRIRKRRNVTSPQPSTFVLLCLCPSPAPIHIPISKACHVKSLLLLEAVLPTPAPMETRTRKAKLENANCEAENAETGFCKIKAPYPQSSKLNRQSDCCFGWGLSCCRCTGPLHFQHCSWGRVCGRSHKMGRGLFYCRIHLGPRTPQSVRVGVEHCAGHCVWYWQLGVLSGRL